jgi:hyperosmotically inducible protein
MRSKLIAMSFIVGGLVFGPTMNLRAAPLPQASGGISTEAADRDTTQKIRKAIVGDKTLSTYAHNVKILAHDGKVTLRGPVRSDDEKRTVAEMASAVAGANNVTNELTVQPAKQ